MEASLDTLAFDANRVGALVPHDEERGGDGAGAEGLPHVRGRGQHERVSAHEERALLVEVVARRVAREVAVERPGAAAAPVLRVTRGGVQLRRAGAHARIADAGHAPTERVHAAPPGEAAFLLIR